jgi:hypothetical protein
VRTLASLLALIRSGASIEEKERCRLAHAALTKHLDDLAAAQQSAARAACEVETPRALAEALRLLPEEVKRKPFALAAFDNISVNAIVPPFGALLGVLFLAGIKERKPAALYLGTACRIAIVVVYLSFALRLKRLPALEAERWLKDEASDWAEGARSRATHRVRSAPGGTGLRTREPSSRKCCLKSRVRRPVPLGVTIELISSPPSKRPTVSRRRLPNRIRSDHLSSDAIALPRRRLRCRRHALAQRNDF